MIIATATKRQPANTLEDPVAEWLQDARSPERTTGFPFAKTVELAVTILGALECGDGLGECGLTLSPINRFYYH